MPLSLMGSVYRSLLLYTGSNKQRKLSCILVPHNIPSEKAESVGLRLIMAPALIVLLHSCRPSDVLARKRGSAVKHTAGPLLLTTCSWLM